MNETKFSVLENMIHNKYKNITGIVVSKNKDILYEKYFNECSKSSHIHVYSVTKSIISMLIGIALDRNYINSVHQKIINFFPNYKVKKSEKNIQNITLENLLTMTAPYKYKISPYTEYFTSSDWAEFSLNLLGGNEQIGRFRYTPLIGPDILSGILVKITGQSVLNFAKETLFKPLSIEVEKSITFQNKEEQLAFNKATTISGWVADSKGLNSAGWRLTLTARDMLKLGQLYLNGGNWKEKQIVSKKWVDESLIEHSKLKEKNLKYGYLWWVLDEKKRSFAAIGDGGNVIYVNSKYNMVVSITSLFAPNVTDRIEFIKKYLEPIFE